MALKAYVRFDGSGRIIPSSVILQRFKPAVGNWKEINANECCNPSPGPTLPLRMLFLNILEVEAIVGDVNNVANWNTFFNLPALGGPFTSVSVTDNEVKLYGGFNIKIKPDLMFNQGDFIIELDDQAGCVTSVGGGAFAYATALTTVNLPECTIVYGYQDAPSDDAGGFGDCTNLVNLNIPKLTTLGSYGFSNCSSMAEINFPSLITAEFMSLYLWTSATSINLPNLISIGSSALYGTYSVSSINLSSCTNLGGTVENNSVFNFISGNTITLTIPSALMTCNSGNPDGDIQYLQANNTVTIITT